MRDLESALCQGTHLKGGVPLGGKAGDPIITCSHDIKSDKNIYVWGDSHARHLLAGLIDTYPAYNIHILYFSSCLSQSGFGGFIYAYEGRTALKEACIDRNRRALEFFQTQGSTSIILHQYFGYEGQFSEAWYDATQKIIDTLALHGHRVAFLGGVPQPGVSLIECLAVPATITIWMNERRCRGNPVLAQRIVHWNKDLSARFPHNFVDISPVFCADSTYCSAIDGNTLIYRDKHHLTFYGAKKMIQAVEYRLSKLLGIRGS